MQEEKTRETRIRYIHYRTGPQNKAEDVSIQHNGNINEERKKITLTNPSTDTVIMEKSEDNIVFSLRFLHLNFRRISPAFFNEFTTVTRLELGCPVPVFWIFKYLPYLRNLKTLRFGQQAFSYEKDDFIEKMEDGFRANDEVQSLELSYDVPRYTGLEICRQQSIDTKISTVLGLANLYFPNLRECALTIPKKIEQNLEAFLEAFPEIRAHGEKRAKYSDGFVVFTNQKQSRKHSDDHRSSKKSSQTSSKRHYEDGGGTSFSNVAAKDPRARPPSKKRVVLTKREPSLDIDRDDDDVVCLEDGPSSSGIPPDYPNHFGHPSIASDAGRTRRHSPSLLENGTNESSSPPYFRRGDSRR